jgi:hypothetical protein
VKAALQDIGAASSPTEGLHQMLAELDLGVGHVVGELRKSFTASGSCSRARRSGFCDEKPSAVTTRCRWPTEYVTPNSRATTIHGTRRTLEALLDQ